MNAPADCVTSDTVGVNEILTQRCTSDPIMNIPNSDAPCVIFPNSPPDKSLAIDVPTLYPNSCVYQMNAILIMFHAKKNNSGPTIFPLNASDAPKAPNIGLNVNQNTGSPTPANGPIIPTLTPWIAWSLISAPFALSSSNANVTPITGADTYGWVL